MLSFRAEHIDDLVQDCSNSRALIQYTDVNLPV